MLLVGFTAGQVQLIDPIKKEPGKLYNEEVSMIYMEILPFEFLSFLVNSLPCHTRNLIDLKYPDPIFNFPVVT